MIMGIGRGGLDPLDFENFSKKVVFLVSSEKKSFTFGPPLKNFVKIPLPWK